jgi:hypothetical protein
MLFVKLKMNDMTGFGKSALLMQYEVMTHDHMLLGEKSSLISRSSSTGHRALLTPLDL